MFVRRRSLRPDRGLLRLRRFMPYDLSLDDRNRIVIAGESYDEDYIQRDDVGLSFSSIARLKG